MKKIYVVLSSLVLLVVLGFFPQKIHADAKNNNLEENIINVNTVTGEIKTVLVETKDGKDVTYPSFIPKNGKTGIAPFSIIGEDERNPVDDTTYFPFSACGVLEATFPDGKKLYGTGWLFSNYGVATAAHVFYSKDHGGTAVSVTFIPGKNNYLKPFGSYNVTNFEIPEKYIEGVKNNTPDSYDYDFAFAKVSGNPGSKLGYFGFSTAVNIGSSTYYETIGYPVDYMDGSLGTAICVSAGGNFIKNVSVRKLCHNIDTVGGQSGSPIFKINGDNYTAVAIHTNGTGNGLNGNWNLATKIDSLVSSIMTKYR